MTEIYDAGSHILIKSGYGNPDMHCHLAAHMILAVNGDMRILTPEGSLRCRGALIPARVSHTVDNGDHAMLVFMFDETTTVAAKIREVEVLKDAVAEEILAKFQEVERSSDKSVAYRDFVETTMGLLGLGAIKCRVTDERILEALSYIDNHIGENLTCTETARHCCLSESRLSHLFREQAGITFSGYVILRRLDHAFWRIAENASITEAAIEAGFSDSAHFAAVNRKMFGITASAIGDGLIFHRINL